MNYRVLGKTGLTIAEVGYGAWGIGKSGWIGASDAESVKALHSPEDQLFPACERHQVGVIVRVALDEGGLTGKITPGTTFEARNVERNCQVGDGRGLPGEQVEKLKAHRWVRDFYE